MHACTADRIIVELQEQESVERDLLANQIYSGNCPP